MARYSVLGTEHWSCMPNMVSQQNAPMPQVYIQLYGLGLSSILYCRLRDESTQMRQ